MLALTRETYRRELLQVVGSTGSAGRELAAVPVLLPDSLLLGAGCAEGGPKS